MLFNKNLYNILTMMTQNSEMFRMCNLRNDFRENKEKHSKMNVVYIVSDCQH